MKLAFRLSLVLFAFPFLVFAQSKPSLGVVLSGGGAKGIAHVGVLKAMEEAGLRPDFIAGTSMGSVVGGLYALGYSADEIEKIILDIDWNQLLANKVPLNYISFEEKEYYSRYLLEFPVDGLQLKLPSGLIEGHILSELLQYYTWSSIPYTGFDEFPIVYRCVSTDVRSGDPIVFKDGSLSTAIRASMALPTAFTAVDLDSTLAVDGGVVNNFPVDVMRQLGAEYVIGVDVSYVSDAPVPASMIGILMNLAMAQSERAMPSMIDLCDIYIHPDLEGNSTASFGNAAEIMEIGHKTGRLYADTLRSFAEVIGMDRESFSLGDTAKSYVLTDLKLEGNTLFGDRLIKNKLGIDVGDTIDRDAMQLATRRVFGINGFRNVEYALYPTEGNEVKATIKMREKLRNSLSASLHIDNVFATGMLLNFTARDLLLRESRSVFVVDISSNPKFRFDYYKYAGPQKSFAVNFRYDYISREIPIYEKGEVEDLVTNFQQEAQINFLTTQSLKQSFLLGGFYSTRKDRTELGISLPDGISDVRAQNIGLRFAYLRNSLNDRNFPTKGAELVIDLRTFFESNYRLNFSDGFEGYEIMEGDSTIFITKDELTPLIKEIAKAIEPEFYSTLFIDWRKFYQINKKNQLIAGIRTGAILSFEERGKEFNTFRLGGHQRVLINDLRAYGYNYTELEPENIGVLGLEYQYVLFGNLFLRAGANVISTNPYVPLDDLSLFSFPDMLENSTTLGYGLSSSFRTRLGPFSAGVSRNTRDSHYRYYFSYGFSFNYSD